MGKNNLEYVIWRESLRLLELPDEKQRFGELYKRP